MLKGTWAKGSKG